MRSHLENWERKHIKQLLVDLEYTWLAEGREMAKRHKNLINKTKGGKTNGKRKHMSERDKKRRQEG